MHSGVTGFSLCTAMGLAVTSVSRSLHQKTSLLFYSFYSTWNLQELPFQELIFCNCTGIVGFAARGTATSCSCLNPRVGLPNAADAESLILIPSQINVLQAKKKFEILDAVRTLFSVAACSVSGKGSPLHSRLHGSASHLLGLPWRCCLGQFWGLQAC